MGHKISDRKMDSDSGSNSKSTVAPVTASSTTVDPTETDLDDDETPPDLDLTWKTLPDSEEISDPNPIKTQDNEEISDPPKTKDKKEKNADRPKTKDSNEERPGTSKIRYKKEESSDDIKSQDNDEDSPDFPKETKDKESVRPDPSKTPDKEQKKIDHAKVCKLLEERRCPICHDVLINACRISCGHTFCRFCIDDRILSSMVGSQSQCNDDQGISSRNKCCPVCGAKISEVQNCPELDTEIDELCTNLSTQEQLCRTGKKSDRKFQVEIHVYQSRQQESAQALHDTQTGSDGRSSDTHFVQTGDDCTHTDTLNTGFHESNCPHSHHNYHFHVCSEGHENEDEDQSESCQYDESGAGPSMVFYETITFHRTRVINPNASTCTEDESTPNNPNSQSQAVPLGPCQNCYHYSCNQQGHSQPHPYAYYCNSYNYQYPYSCQNQYQQYYNQYQKYCQCNQQSNYLTADDNEPGQWQCPYDTSSSSDYFHPEEYNYHAPTDSYMGETQAQDNDEECSEEHEGGESFYGEAVGHHLTSHTHEGNNFHRVDCSYQVFENPDFEHLQSRASDYEGEVHHSNYFGCEYRRPTRIDINVDLVYGSETESESDAPSQDNGYDYAPLGPDIGVEQEDDDAERSQDFEDLLDVFDSMGLTSPVDSQGHSYGS